MSSKTESYDPLNEQAAAQVIEDQTDQTVKNLLTLFLVEARMRYMRLADQSEQEWRASLPDEPFDMRFFMSVVAKVLGRKEIFERVQAGQSPAQATGWDLESEP